MYVFHKLFFYISVNIYVAEIHIQGRWLRCHNWKVLETLLCSVVLACNLCIPPTPQPITGSAGCPTVPTLMVLRTTASQAGVSVRSAMRASSPAQAASRSFSRGYGTQGSATRVVEGPCEGVPGAGILPGSGLSTGPAGFFLSVVGSLCSCRFVLIPAELRVCFLCQENTALTTKVV